MSKDTDGTLAQIYSRPSRPPVKSVSAPRAGPRRHGLGRQRRRWAEPIPFEKACEIQGAMTAWSNTGQDVNALLQSQFGMNAADWAAATPGR